MIRPEVERLRGFLFTEEEIRDVIRPILIARGAFIVMNPEDAEDLKKGNKAKTKKEEK